MLYPSPHAPITQQILEAAVQMKDFLFWNAIIIDGKLQTYIIDQPMPVAA